MYDGGFAAHGPPDEHESVPDEHHFVHLNHFLREAVRHQQTSGLAHLQRPKTRLNHHQQGMRGTKTGSSWLLRATCDRTTVESCTDESDLDRIVQLLDSSVTLDIMEADSR